jgi:hypothetical protein
MDTMLKLWRKQCWRIIFFMSFAIACSPSILYAQNASEPTAAIVYSMGGDFILSRQDGSRAVYSPEFVYENAILLQNSDYIQTAPGVFVEIMINPGGTSIILAENTSMIFETTSDLVGPNVISLVYGRIYVNQKRATVTTIVRAVASITEIQNGAINFDLIASPESIDSQLTFCVSTISGRAVFIPSAASPENSRVRLKTRETIIFYPNSSIIDRKQINKELVDYWTYRTGSQNVNVTGHMLEPPNVDRVIALFDDPDPSYSGRAAYLKTRFLIAGLITMTAGAVWQSFVYFTPDIWTNDSGTSAFSAGYAPLGLGILMLLAAYFY